MADSRGNAGHSYMMYNGNLRAVNNMTDVTAGGGRQRRGNAPTKCVCPKCGYEVEKTRGVPCMTHKCPKCDIPLMGD